MKILAQEKCFDELCGMTINEINTFYGEDDLLTTRHNLVMRVRTLVKDGYMEKGIKDHLEFTYFITEKGLGLGAVLPLFRLLLTGQGAGASMFEITEFLGKQEAVARMKAGITAVEALKK